MSFVFRGIRLPEDTKDSIDRYVRQGVAPGGFLEAVIENDLKGACGAADETNLPALPAIVAYFYNECPARCWGAKGAMVKWLAHMDTLR